MMQRIAHGRSRSLSDPLARALLPPEDESPYERDSRLQREEAARRVSDQIDQQIRQEKAELKQQKNIRKVLLLGQVRSWQICLKFTHNGPSTLTFTVHALFVSSVQSESGKSTTLKRECSALASLCRVSIQTISQSFSCCIHQLRFTKRE